MSESNTERPNTNNERPKDHADPTLPGGERKFATAGGVAVYEQGAGNALAGPGTGRAVSSPIDARVPRVASFALADFEVPTGREEEWRFTPFDRLRGLHSGGGAETGPSKVIIDVHAPDAVEVGTAERGDARLGRAVVPRDRVSARAWQGFENATVVRVPAAVEVAEPVYVHVRGEGTESPAFGHVLVDVGAQSRATVILDYSGSATYADNVEIVVGDGAAVTVVSLQEWEPDTVHLGTQGIKLGRDATLKVFQVTLGGDLVRFSSSVAFDGPGGDAELFGLTFADTGQHLENRLFVDHSEPHCRSRVSYKVALQGDDAHTVWIGDVLIAPNALGTDTYESNRNLLLTEGARADSVPNLEILTGEIVGAGHASATGRFDDEQLFYLQARGIPADEARRLVVRGFFAEIIERVGITELRDRLLAQIEDELARVGSGVSTAVGA